MADFIKATEEAHDKISDCKAVAHLVKCYCVSKYGGEWQVVIFRNISIFVPKKVKYGISAIVRGEMILAFGI